MSQVPLILNYSSLRPKAGSRLALQEADGQVRVLFAVTPRWMFLIPVAFALLIGVVCLVLAISSLSWWSQIPGSLTVNTPDSRQEALEDVAGSALCAVFALTAAALAFWRYRRWVRDHRVLAATKNGLLLSRVGWWRLHQRWWPVDEIAAIELAPVWGSLPVIDTVAYLFIHTRTGRRRRLYLDTPDRTLPDRIAERLSAVLGCELKRPAQGL
jgi:amino acid transporter